jgi:molybdopterin synthase sulfur carrier subunit
MHIESKKVAPTAIEVSVKLFAGAAELIGRRELTVTLPPDATVYAAFTALTAEHPEIAAMRPILRFAVNHDFAEPDRVLHDGDELALIPPVSGG